ncbi:hypothetical protein BH09PLA1_BH09PLA1_25550 [soil metagenome]
MIDPSNPLSIALVSVTLTALIRFSVPSLQVLFDRLGSVAATIARSWIRSAALIFFFSLTISAIPSAINGVPVPLVHDEFAYLLQGDTFAHGRLTNPPHPMAEFLETFHVLQHPTYAAKFPVGQGVALAIGFRLGLPIIGVWLSIALACVAVDWMLRAFVSPRWSLIGGLLCALHPLIAWWSQSYWGGGVAMLGGAILIGAGARATSERPRAIHGALIGIALAILANTRPLEGLILAVLAWSWLTWKIASIRARIIIPAAAALVPTFAFMLFYNFRVTGSATTMPYVAHAKQHMIAPLLFGQSLNDPPAFHHQVFADFYNRMELNEYRNERWWKKWPMLVINYVSPAALIVPLVASLWAWRRQRGLAFALVLCIGLPAIHMLITPWMRPAYMAPLIGPLYLAIVVGLRELLRRGAFTFVLFVIISTVVAAVVLIKPQATLSHAPLAVERTKLIDDLTTRGGKHLVIVTYGPHHEPLFEFVFNRAGIDQSPVVFARSIDPQKDRELLDYFHDRQIWELFFDEGTYRVSPR